MRVAQWEPKEDNITSDVYHSFFDNETWLMLDEQMRSGNIGMETKIGGVPYWLQEPGGYIPPHPWRFAIQLSSSYRFEGHAPAFNADELGCSVTRKVDGTIVHEYPKRWPPGRPRWITIEDDYWTADAANFGDGGMAYIFVLANNEAANALMFSQSL